MFNLKSNSKIANIANNANVAAKRVADRVNHVFFTEEGRKALKREYEQGKLIFKTKAVARKFTSANEAKRKLLSFEGKYVVKTSSMLGLLDKYYIVENVFDAVNNGDFEKVVVDPTLIGLRNIEEVIEIEKVGCEYPHIIVDEKRNVLFNMQMFLDAKEAGTPVEVVMVKNVPYVDGFVFN